MSYFVKGKIIKGDGYGRKIGYPTINLDRRNFLKLKDKPQFGVYAGKVQIEVKPLSVYKAGIVIGPLDKTGLPKIEAHLIGYHDPIGKTYGVYGTRAVFEINKFLRKFKKFKTEQELTEQIEKDLEKC